MSISATHPVDFPDANVHIGERKEGVMTDKDYGLFAQRVMYQVDRLAALLFRLPEPKTVEERLATRKAAPDQVGVPE